MKITKDKRFKTWNLGGLPGTPQNEKTQGVLDEMLINRPGDKAGKTGESFLEFSSRVLGAIKELVEVAPHNTAVLTHNSVFGLIQLWDKKGRPKNLDRPFRTEYTKQGSDTGAHFKIKSKNGEVYICRHGETQDNIDGLFRQDDVDLTDKGRDEAAALGKELKKDGVSEIVASPLPRTMETAEIIEGILEGKSAEEAKEEVEEKEEEKSKGLSKSAFLYMAPGKGDNPKTFATCGSCCMFLAKHEICSLHGKDVKVDADDSCGLYSRGGPAPESEMEHVHVATTPEESGLVEGPVTCKNCHYFDKSDQDCLLFRLLGIKDYKVEPDACCNAFSPKHKPAKEDSKEDKAEEKGKEKMTEKEL